MRARRKKIEREKGKRQRERASEQAKGGQERQDTAKQPLRKIRTEGREERGERGRGRGWIKKRAREVIK
jgi:hypothetical protein